MHSLDPKRFGAGVMCGIEASLSESADKVLSRVPEQLQERRELRSKLAKHGQALRLEEWRERDDHLP